MSIDEVLANQRPYWVEQGDALSVLKTMPDGCIHVAMTSPPYFSLRDYQTGKWEGGDSGCDHKTGKKWRTKAGFNERYFGKPFDTDKQGEDEEFFKDLCGKCGARRIDQQLGLEDRHDCQGWATGQPCGSCFICHLLAVFTEVKRVLRQDGVLIVNIGDSYSGGAGGYDPKYEHETAAAGPKSFGATKDCPVRKGQRRAKLPVPGYESGQLLGIPWRFALAMQANGWLLRSSVVWQKGSPMPESVQSWRWERHRIRVKGDSGPNRNGLRGLNTDGGWTSATHPETRRPAEWEPCPGCDRCLPNGGYVLRKGSWRPTRSHEHVFIFAKSDKYWCDGDAVRTPLAESSGGRQRAAQRGTFDYANCIHKTQQDCGHGLRNGGMYTSVDNPLGANLRDVLWTDEGPLFRLRPDLTDGQLRQVAEILEPCQSAEQGDVLRLGPEPCSIALILNPSPDCPVHAGQPGPIYVDRPPSSWKKCKCERTSHFAAFPTTLCRPFLEAFCPARCCAECGTGWVRVVERDKHPLQYAELRRAQEAERTGRRDGRTDGPDGHTDRVTTLGWRPACNCNSQAEPTPGVALDVFAGTCTLLLTARRMGLRALGVELSPAYATLGRERLRRDNLLFSELPASSSGPQPEPAPEPEPDLFGALED